MKAAEAIDDIKLAGLVLAIGAVAYVAWQAYKTGKGVAESVAQVWDAAAAKVDAVIEFVKDPSEGRSYGSALDESAKAQAERLKTGASWETDPGVTVNAYGDFSYGGEVVPYDPNNAMEP
ncbi:MAG: hypothetical protein ACREUQ_07390 [Burkholderiales bacterium]